MLKVPQSPTIKEYLVDSDDEGECEDNHASSPSHPHSHPPNRDSAITSYPHGSDLPPDAQPHSYLRPYPSGLSNGDSLSVPSSRVHTRSASMEPFPSPHPPPTPPSIPQSHTAPSLAPRVNGHRTHSRRAPSLQLHDGSRLGALRLEDAALSPVTPNYRFGVDEHFASHQHANHHGHTPNLHDHSHVHGGGHTREGHSHNMRGLFLHVMAVSVLLPFISPRYLESGLQKLWRGGRLGHAGLGRGDRIDAAHPVLRLDRFRSDRVDLHRAADRCERDPTRHRHRQSTRVGRCAARRRHRRCPGRGTSCHPLPLSCPKKKILIDLNSLRRSRGSRRTRTRSSGRRTRAA